MAEKKTIITIGRQAGSGGKEIGVKLAERLGIPCYEQQILRMASESSGINEMLFNLADERIDLSDKLKGLPFHYVVEPSDKRLHPIIIYSISRVRLSGNWQIRPHSL